MGEVTISVAGRPYQVICEDGEEDRLKSIAARVDEEASVFTGASPSLSEARLLLMSALLLADKLDDAEKQAGAATSTVAATPSAPVQDMSQEAALVDEAIARIAALSEATDAPETATDIMTEEEAPDEQVETEDTAVVAVSADQEIALEDEANSPPEPEEEPARRSKSSAAMAAERDLLSWLDRPETPATPDEPITPEAPVVVDEEPREEEEPEAVAEADPTPVETDTPGDGDTAAGNEDEEAMERAERRRRRRERLARLAERDD